MRIIYENDDGSIDVIEPSEWALANGWTIDKIAAKDVPTGKSFEIVEDFEIPSDRTYRGAWEKNGRVVEVDMPKARTLHMSRIREARINELTNIDNEIKALEDTGGNTDDARKKRQVLRDIPQTIGLESATTPQELKEKWPNNLPKQ